MVLCKEVLCDAFTFTRSHYPVITVHAAASALSLATAMLPQRRSWVSMTTKTFYLTQDGLSLFVGLCCCLSLIPSNFLYLAEP